MINSDFERKLEEALELMKENHTPMFTETSKVELFNKIGEYAKRKGFKIKFFSWKRIPMNYYAMDDIELGEMRYIHILDSNMDMLLSIYYDDKDMGASVGVPYYELYDCNDIERFFVDEEEEQLLFDRVKFLLSMKKKRRNK